MSGPALSTLAAAPVFPTLGRLALPIMLSLVFGALANAVDMAFISQFSQSDRAIAALSVIFPVADVGGCGGHCSGGLAGQCAYAGFRRRQAGNRPQSDVAGHSSDALVGFSADRGPVCRAAGVIGPAANPGRCAGTSAGLRLSGFAGDDTGAAGTGLV